MVFDPLELITFTSLTVGIIVGFFTIKNEVKKNREEQRKSIENKITSQTDRVIEVIDSKLKIVDEKLKITDRALSDNKEDIENVEGDVKQMVIDFRKMCDTISKHNYVIEDLVPDFKALKTEFYKFKTAVDINLVTKKPDISINTEKS